MRHFLELVSPAGRDRYSLDGSAYALSKTVECVNAGIAQELDITLLISRGVRLLTASGDDLTASDDPSRKMMRQIAGAFAEYEKARLVAKLRHEARPP